MIRRPRGADPLLAAIERRAPLVLAAMMVVTAVVWWLRGRGVAGPWFFTDEFIHWEIGRNLAERGVPAVRDQQLYYSLVVPLLAVPGHLLGNEEFAYAWIKTINPIVMALGAIPAYGVARAGGLRPILALGCAGTALAMPAFAYTGSVLTEPAFLPAFLAAVWALARALERPSAVRQIVAILAVLLAIAVRVQGVALVASMALAVAFVVLAARGPASGDARLAGRLQAYAPMLAFSVVLPLVGVASQVARGASLRSLLGGYSTATADAASAGVLLDWTGRHVAILALSVAVLPLAVAIGTWASLFSRRFAADGRDAVLLASLAAILPMLVLVTVFAANNATPVQERYLFYVQPLVVVCALIGLTDRYRRAVAIGAAALLAVLMIQLPLAELLVTPPLPHTMSLYAIFDAAPELRASVSAIIAGIAVLGVVLTTASAWAPRRAVVVAIPLCLIAFSLALSWRMTRAITGYTENLAAATLPAQRDWVERADTAGEPVGLLWPSDQPSELAWQAEFFNPKIETVVGFPNPLTGLTARAAVDPVTGLVVPVDSTAPAFPERFVVAPLGLDLSGRRVAAADLLHSGLGLYEASRPLRVNSLAAGYFPDGWTAAEVLVRRFRCAGGTFVTTLGHGFGARQRVIVTTSGGPARRVTLVPGKVRELRLPASPEPATGTCLFGLRVLDTATDDEISGSGNPRVLGVLASAPVFTPS